MCPIDKEKKVNEKIKIITDSGQKAEAMAPVIISASRSTDIPAFYAGLQQFNKKWKFTLATCAEPIDLKAYGVAHNCCIDGELMKRLFAEDADFVYYLTYGKLPEKNVLFPVGTPRKEADLKDKGQRKLCGCIISKDIGMYNTCPHFVSILLCKYLS